LVLIVGANGGGRGGGKNTCILYQFFPNFPLQKSKTIRKKAVSTLTHIAECIRNMALFGTIKNGDYSSIFQKVSHLGKKCKNGVNATPIYNAPL